MVSRGECQCVHWVKDVTERPCTVGGEVDMLLDKQVRLVVAVEIL